MRPVVALVRLALPFVALAGACGGAPSARWRARSPDGSHHAEITVDQDGQRLLMDGRAVGVYRAIAAEHVAWADRAAVVPVQTERGWHVLAGDALGPAHEAVGELLVAQGRVVYSALDDDGWRVFVDGTPGPTHRTLLAGSLVSSRGHLAYAARDDDGARAVLDGQRGPAFRHVDRLGFAGKGGRLLYVAYDDEGARVVDGAEPGDRFDAVHELALAPGEPRWAAIVERGGALSLLRDGHASPLAPGSRELALSDDGERIAFVSPVEAGARVWLDGEAGPAHVDAETPRFVPVSGALLYVARTDDGFRVMHDGAPGPRFDAIEPPVTSAAGAWGYVGHRRAGSATVVNGEAVFRGAWASSPQLAVEGDGWACVARRGGRRFVMTRAGATEVHEPFVDTLVLSGDGRHWAIAVADLSRRELRIVVDGDDTAELRVEELAVELERRGDGSAAARAMVASELAAVSAAR